MREPLIKQPDEATVVLARALTGLTVTAWARLGVKDREEMRAKAADVLTELREARYELVRIGDGA